MLDNALYAHRSLTTGIVVDSLPLLLLQDDAQDALKSRGKFSRYRGLTFAQELMPPAVYGEVDVAGQSSPSASTSIAPLETVEESAVAAAQMEAQLAAEASMATAAVTAAIERSMGLKPRSAGKAAAATAEQSFFKRYQAGACVVSPAAPASGERREVARAEPSAPAGDKGKDKGKGAKPGAKAGGKK
jgi:hypothetical protein